MYVPLIRVTITPVQNAEKPGIEKTERTQACPPYMIRLFKAKWGARAKVVASDRADAGEDLWQVPEMPGLTPAESETKRMRNFFGNRVFESVYRDHDFEEEFRKVAVEENPAIAARAKRMEEAAANGSKIAAEALLAAAGGEAAKRARATEEAQRKTRTPRQPKVQPIEV